MRFFRFTALATCLEVKFSLNSLVEDFLQKSSQKTAYLTADRIEHRA